MGLLNKFFGEGRKSGNEGKMEFPWIPLTEINQLDEIEAESLNASVAIFKHSTRCGISKMVLRKFESEYSGDEKGAKLYFLDLLKYRGISNEIANRYGVRHESPQLIVLKGGKVVSHASHQAIEAEMVVGGN
ncbi:MAG TPA: bacillithiol system redox-active protein YtxJ [Salinimicrobium sp.]|nr:bacillithiol system redox-active protein YtxJ [Salinimicrobium sp.]